MNAQTLLQILFANGHESIVALAVKLDSGIEPEQIPTHIVVGCEKKHIPAGFKSAKDGYSIYLSMPVIGYNKYKLKDEYLVQFPDGTTAWKSTTTNAVTELVPAEAAREAIAVL